MLMFKSRFITVQLEGILQMDIVGVLIQLIIGTVILAPALWVAGRWISGKEKAKFSDALWIALLGIIINVVVAYFIGNLVATIIVFIAWLLLIKHFFDCGWLKALLIAFVAVVIFAIIIAALSIIVAIIGIGTIAPWI
jgi:hypothetical protein